MNPNGMMVANLVATIISAAVAALVAYVAMSIRAQIATQETRMLRLLTEYVRKEDCRQLRGLPAMHSQATAEEQPC